MKQILKIKGEAKLMQLTGFYLLIKDFILITQEK